MDLNAQARVSWGGTVDSVHLWSSSDNDTRNIERWNNKEGIQQTAFVPVLNLWNWPVWRSCTEVCRVFCYAHQQGLNLGSSNLFPLAQLSCKHGDSFSWLACNLFLWWFRKCDEREQDLRALVHLMLVQWEFSSWDHILQQYCSERMYLQGWLALTRSAIIAIVTATMGVPTNLISLNRLSSPRYLALNIPCHFISP